MKTAKLFRNAQSRAVRLPKEFRFEGDEVFIRKSGSALAQRAPRMRPGNFPAAAD